MLKFPNSNQPEVLEQNEIIKKAYTEGLYFITDEESANRILEESQIEAMPPIESYGIKNTFVFAGIPTMEMISARFGLQKKLIAIRLKLSYESLVRFSEHTTDSLYYDQVYVNNIDVSKVYLYLKCKNNMFVFEESKMDVPHHLKIAYKDIKKIEKKLALELKKYKRILIQIEKGQKRYVS